MYTLCARWMQVAPRGNLGRLWGCIISWFRFRIRSKTTGKRSCSCQYSKRLKNDEKKVTYQRLVLEQEVKKFLYRSRQALQRPRSSRISEFLDNWFLNVVRLSLLCTGSLYVPEDNPGTHFCWRLIGPQVHSADRWIKPMKNPNDPIGNRIRDLPTCRAVPQPTVPQRTPLLE